MVEKERNNVKRDTVRKEHNLTGGGRKFYY